MPALVSRYLDRVLPAGGSVPQQVRVAQVGEMCQKPGGRWLRFSAVGVLGAILLVHRDDLGTVPSVVPVPERA